MNRWFLMTVTIIAGTLLFLLGACDKTDSPLAPNDLARKSTTDSSLVESSVGGRLFSTPLQSLELSAALLEAQDILNSSSRTAVTRAADDSSQIIISAIAHYEYTNGWHVFDFTAVVIDTATHDTVEIAGIDSVQVLIEGLPQVAAPEGVEPDGLKARAHFGWNLITGDVSCDLHHRLDIAADGQELDTILTIDGTVNDTLHATDVNDSLSCLVDVAYDVLVSHLQLSALAGENDCPLGGEIDAVVKIDAECAGNDLSHADSVEVHGTWTINAVVNNDNTVTIRYVGPILSFTTTASCADEAPQRSVWWTGRLIGRPTAGSQINKTVAPPQLTGAASFSRNAPGVGRLTTGARVCFG